MARRSFLFVPGNRPARFDKACAVGADVVIIDLEDAVAPPEKSFARNAIGQWLGPASGVYLRINAPDSEWFADDLELARLAGVAGIVLPKAERREHIESVAARCKGKAIVPLIETAAGLWLAESIARSSAVELLAFGSLDFQLDLGITGEEEELLPARSELVLISRVAGLLPPVDGVTMVLDDDAVLEHDIKRARRLGFGGKLCIHPRQVMPVNAGFAPQAAELEWARAVVRAAEEAGNNAVRLEGKMIDQPVIARARALLAASGQS